MFMGWRLRTSISTSCCLENLDHMIGEIVGHGRDQSGGGAKWYAREATSQSRKEV